MTVRTFLVRTNWEGSPLQSNLVSPLQSTCIASCLPVPFPLAAEWIFCCCCRCCCHPHCDEIVASLPLLWGLKVKGSVGVLHALSTPWDSWGYPASWTDWAGTRFFTSPQETDVIGLFSCQHVSQANKSPFVRHIHSLSFFSLESPNW